MFSLVKHPKMIAGAPQPLCNGNTLQVEFCFGRNIVNAFEVFLHTRRTQSLKIYLPEDRDEPPRRQRYGLEGASPLHWACSKGYLDVLEILIAHEACIYTPARGDTAPIHLACENGHLEIVKVLLAHDHSIQCNRGYWQSFDPVINVKNKVGLSPLYFAMRSGHVEVAEYLLARGADFRIGFDDFRLGDVSALHMAAQNGQVPVVKALLTRGADRYLDKNWLSPLALLCLPSEKNRRKRGRTNETMRVLIQYSAKGEDLKRYFSLGPNFTPAHGSSVGLLLDYGIINCEKHIFGKCSQQCVIDPQLMEYYMEIRKQYMDDNTRHIVDYLDSYERFFIKVDAAGLSNEYGLTEDTVAVDPPVVGIDWSQSQRNYFRKICCAELERMKVDAIPNTTATYFDLLSRNRPALRDHRIVGNFDFDACVRDYPVYGDMTSCSYLALRDFMVVSQSQRFFHLTEPQLPLECAEMIQVYLSGEDLENLVEACQKKWLAGDVAKTRLANSENRKKFRKYSLQETAQIKKPRINYVFPVLENKD